MRASRRHSVLGLFLLSGVLAVFAAPDIHACTAEEIAQYARQGFSDAQIRERCPTCPSWEDDMSPRFNSKCIYVGSQYVTCRGKRIGSDFDACVQQVEEWQAEREAEAQRAKEALQARVDACHNNGMYWEHGECITPAQSAARVEQQRWNDVCEDRRRSCGGQWRYDSNKSCGGYCHEPDDHHGK